MTTRKFLELTTSPEATLRYGAEGASFLGGQKIDISFNASQVKAAIKSNTRAIISLTVKPARGLSTAYMELFVYIGSAPISSFMIFGDDETTVDLPEINLSDFGGIIAFTILANFVEPSGCVISGGHEQQLTVVLVNAEAREADIHAKRKIIEAGHIISAARFGESGQEDPWHNADLLYSKIQFAIQNKQPFSIIRLGDGEGRVLGYGSIFSDVDVAFEVLRYQYGPGCLDRLAEIYGNRSVAEAMALLRKMICGSIHSADMIGAPAPHHFRVEPTPQNVQGLTGFASVWISQAGSLGRFGNDALFDTFIFRGFSRKGHFSRLLTGLDFLGIVTHTDISSAIRSKFGVDTVKHFAIPGHQSFMPSSELHFPDGFRKVAGMLEVPFPGALFFVGAGYLGKMYCDVIKQRGGIAIDVGSVFDEWSGMGRPDATSARGLRLV